MRHNRSPGFTIIELLIVVAILGILSAIAAPSFREFIVGSQIRSAASELYGSALMARSEAIKRNASIDVIPSGSGWAGGWTVKVNASGKVLENHEALSNVTVTPNASGNLSFRIDGRVSTNVRNFTLYNTQFTTISARCVFVDAAGRPSVRTDNDGNAANGCV